MKTTIILVAFFTIISCKPQNKQQENTQKIKHYKMDKKNEYNKLLTNEFEFFDKIRFDKNKNESEDYTYTLSNGNIITESGGLDSEEHIVQIVVNNSLYTIQCRFLKVIILNP